MVTTRFAPSPTGQLHLGHAVSAIRAHDMARGNNGNNGRFLLRIEDIDGVRSRPEHVAGIVEDLRWLGLEWDGPIVFQSQRLALYQAALDRLKQLGLLYPCFCTRADIMREIAASASAPHAGPDGIPYPGTCRNLDATTQVLRLVDEAHAWRIDIARATALAGELYWKDEALGEVLADPPAHGDVVLARKDAPASYHLAVSVDDADQGVTDVVRGRDLLAATHVHRLLQALLGLPTPAYHHHPLIVGVDGKRLAKRDGAPTLAMLRATGVDGARLADELRQGLLPAGFRFGPLAFAPGLTRLAP